MITIPLTKGYVAVVDDVDAHLADHKWHAQIDDDRVYARRWDGTDAQGKQIGIKLHRAVLGVTDPKILVDHRNGNGLDCRRTNLRKATSAVNSRNLGGPRKSNKTSSYLGVTLRHGKYRARIQENGKCVQIGKFDTAEEANDARIAYETKIWGKPLRR